VDNVDRGLAYNLEDVAIAHLQQSKIARNWLDLFEEVDVVICPAASTSPFSHTEWSVTEIDDAEMATYMRWLAITYLPTMALASGVVLPCGVDDNNMPFGIQVLGPPGNDRLIIEVARALEATLSEHTITQQPKPNLDRLSA
jgi:Asp-tRNA(Asn)/Glu-tRNA(Gln) amidotransferase A subunit family amidase